MSNEKVKSYYDKMAKKINSPTETRNKAKDFTHYDVAFVKQYADNKMSLLDLGSGTGLLINNLIDDFKSITAVEKYEEFSQFIKKDKKINLIHQDLLELNLGNVRFDIITMFGIMNYFNKEEAKSIYEKVYNYLNDKKILIVKNQMGVDADVTVDGFSEELQTNYYSNYRYVKEEVKLLESIGFKDIEVVDIYPKEYNRWDDTHFYALVCKKG